MEQVGGVAGRSVCVGHIHVSCHTSVPRSLRIHQMILSITISSWLIKRNDMSCIWRMLKKKKWLRQLWCSVSVKRKIKSLQLPDPPPLQSWFRGIYSKPHIIPCIQSHPYKSVHSLKHNIPFSVFSVKSLCLASFSVSGLLQSSFTGHSSCSLSASLCPQFSSLFSQPLIKKKKTRTVQINKAQQRQNRQVQGRPSIMFQLWQRCQGTGYVKHIQ